MLQKITKNDLNEFVDICVSLFQIDGLTLRNETEMLIKWHSGGQLSQNVIELSNKWYESLKIDPEYPVFEPDYGVYNSIFYLAETWACWKLYSRNYLKVLLAPNSAYQRSVIEDMGEINKVVDVGCGIGYTTKALELIFPSAEVYGTNFENSYQWCLNKHFGVNVKTDIKEIGKADLIVAFEYFEHFQNPVEHLKYLVETSNPDYFLLANSFGTKSVGHFLEQEHEGKMVPSKGFGRVFNKALRDLGYQQVETKIYNRKPAYWKKIKK